ncbi:MAG TPA: D-amino-acid transaminase [Xanthobacteraceae bacterium]|nr:D-amino-acid transaminase [Xanthobacteraceae bacterium]
MSRIAYVNGRYVPHSHAMVHVEDRGYQFSDGVYEVCEVRGGHLIDERRHLARLKRSLDELRIRTPMEPAALGIVLRETVRRNRVRNGLVYIQATRGVARRDHAFPPADTPPSLVVTARNLDFAANDRQATEGVAVITLPDNRWSRVDIKTVALLPNVLAKQAAREQGAREAWFVDRDGFVTEGSSTNAWIVTERAIVTRPAEEGILRGITRTVLIEMAARLGLAFEERPFTVDEAYAAREAFVTAASQIVMPVIRIDGRSIGDGRPGPVTGRLRSNFHAHAERS